MPNPLNVSSTPFNFTHGGQSSSYLDEPPHGAIPGYNSGKYFNNTQPLSQAIQNAIGGTYGSPAYRRGSNAAAAELQQLMGNGGNRAMQQ